MQIVLAFLPGTTTTEISASLESSLRSMGYEHVVAGDLGLPNTTRKQI